MKSFRIPFLTLLFVLLFSFGTFKAAEIENEQIKTQIQYFQNRLMLSDLISYIDSLETDDASILLVKAKSQFQLGLKSEAENTIQEILFKNQTDVSAIADLANFAEAIDNKELAIELLNHAINLEPLPAFLMQKGNLIYSLKRYDLSLQIADSVLMQANLPQAVRLKARNLAAMKRTSESIAVLRDYLNTDPSDVSTLTQLANLYMAVDSFPQMVSLTADYLNSYDAENNDVLHLNALGNYLSKNYEQAVNQYKILEKRNVPFDQNQNYFAGMAHYFFDETYPLDAIPFFARADSIVNGGSYVFKYYLAKCYDNMGQWSWALHYYKEAYELIKPDTVQLVQVLNKLGTYTMRNSKLDQQERGKQTIAYYQQALNLDDKNKYAIISIAMAYDYMDDTKNAVKYYKQMLELEPDPEKHSYSKIAKRNLEKLEKK